MDGGEFGNRHGAGLGCGGRETSVHVESTRGGGNARFLREAGCELQAQMQQKLGRYLVFWFPAVSCGCSSAFCQVELGLYSVMALAMASVLAPRSF